ncbi:hypothetical protein EV668_3941 [Enterovirga rhinocerotis]|uniref:Uncharacterized protein n=1 Tax=Enterovirga rhinocerotis TaxID=1339210 RepID=A0A4R7BU21_9HYPH|nr:hypothetical protein EV668_3941 [Enterovirga rhinocerotis]
MVMPVIMPVIVTMGVIVRVSVSVSVSMTTAMRMPVIVPMMMVVMMIMAAATAGTVIVIVIVMPVIVVMRMAAGLALGPERALDLLRLGAETSHQLQQAPIMADIESVVGDLGGNVPIADMPGHLHQARRVVRPDLDQPLRSGLDPDEPPVLQFHRIAIVEDGRAVEIEHDLEPAIRRQRPSLKAAAFVIERQRIEDPLRLDGGAAEDGGGAEHGLTRFCRQGF